MLSRESGFILRAITDHIQYHFQGIKKYLIFSLSLLDFIDLDSVMRLNQIEKNVNDVSIPDFVISLFYNIYLYALKT